MPTEVWFQTPVRTGGVRHANVPWMIHISGSGADDLIEPIPCGRSLTEIEPTQRRNTGRALPTYSTMSLNQVHQNPACCILGRNKLIGIPPFLRPHSPLCGDMGRKKEEGMGFSLGCWHSGGRGLGGGEARKRNRSLSATWIVQCAHRPPETLRCGSYQATLAWRTPPVRTGGILEKSIYAQNPDSSSHLFGTSQGAGTAILTLLGGFHPQTQSLWLTDMAHHHLAIAFIFLIAGHMYRTNFGIGHSMKDLLDAHIPPGGRLGRGHKGLYDTINNSLHFQLGLALASLGVITSLVAQHMYSLPAYAFIAQDFTTQAALYTHHQYIAGFIMTGAFAHGAIFFIRDYNPEQNEDNVLARMLEHKEAIISHLSWASLFLGFHTLGLYVHNDVMLAFGTPEK
ncbi:photosystem I P700 apoprotein A2, partial [Tanacetum coccineum]